MFPVSQAYIDAVFAKNRRDRLEGVITLATGSRVPFSDADLQAGTVSIDNQCVNGEELEFGAVYAGQFTMTFRTDLDRYQLFGAVLTASYFLQLADGTFEELPLGRYQITEANRKGKNITVKAIDAMLSLEQAWGGSQVYGTVYELLAWICESCGVELANAPEEIEAMPNGTAHYQLDTAFAGCCSTYRDLVAVLAQSMGCYATADRAGRIALRQMALSPSRPLPEDVRTSTEISDFRVTYRGLKVTLVDGSVLESYDPDRTDGQVMCVQDNPCFSAGLPETRQQLADALRGLLCGYAYTPASISFVGDPALECGDMLTIPVSGADTRVLVHTYTWKYRGGHALQSVGKNPYLANAQSREDKRINQLLNTGAKADYLVVTTQAIKQVKLGADLKSLVKLRFVTGDNGADLLFNGTFLLDVVADEGAVLSFVYELNGERDTYHTPQQTVRTGAHTVTLFRPLMETPAGTNNALQVLASTSGGTVTLRAYGGYASVHGTGLVNTGEPPWDGTITLEESITPWEIGSGLTFVPLAGEAVACVTQTPTASSLNETLARPWALGSGLSLVAFSAEATAGYVQQKQTVSTVYAARYAYDRALVDTAAGDFRLQLRFVALSEEQPIDAGRMSVLRIDTGQFASVESIEVT